MDSTVRIGLALALASLTVGGALLSAASADPAPQKAVVSKILSEYARLRSYALDRASQLREEGREDEAQAITAAVMEADDLFSEARDAYEAGDLETAGQKVREAFNVIRESLRGTGEAPGVSAARRVAAGIERNRRMLERLSTVVARLRSIGIDVSGLESSLESASTLLDEAQSLLERGQVREAAGKLVEAHRILERVAREIREIVSRIRRVNVTDRAERIVELAEKTISRLQELEDRLTEANRTDAAARVAEVRGQLQDLLSQFKEQVQAGDEEGARRTLSQMVSVLRSLARYLRARR